MYPLLGNFITNLSSLSHHGLVINGGPLFTVFNSKLCISPQPFEYYFTIWCFVECFLRPLNILRDPKVLDNQIILFHNTQHRANLKYMYYYTYYLRITFFDC